MAQEQNISTQLDNLLVTRNFAPEMLDRQGKPSESEDAKTFTFDYVSGSGKNYGTMVVILDSENDMKVFYGDNLGRAMEGDDKDEFFDFQQHLSKFARMHRWTYTAKDLNQLKHTMQGLAAIQEGLFEGYYGTRKISYAGEPTEARLMIKHNRTLGEADARFRYVESLFIETADSQRFKLAFKNLAGGRAMLEHVRQGGNPYDVRGVHISEMVMEIATLSRFNRASASRMLEGTTKELVTEAQTYYKSLRENMKRMASPRGYNAYFETWHPATIDEQQELVEDIKTLFIEQTLDTRIEAALPLLARIQQQGNAMKEAQIFENWINSITEGTWSLPETPEQLNRLKELMATELIVGPDATNATEQLYDLIGDDILFDRLGDLAERDPRANVWDDTEVMDRLEELGIQMSEPAEPAAQEPAPDTAAPAAQPAPVAPPVAEQLNKMRKDAGLPVVESRVLDESGETLTHILDRFKHEVAQFEQGADLDDNLYDALYDYYSDKGEIPYGIAKARTGDPYEWITNRLDQELGINESNSGMIMPEADPISTFEVMSGFAAPVAESSCNMTTEGEYCPEHGLMECGVYEMGTVAGGIAPVMGKGNQLSEDSGEFQHFRGGDINQVPALDLLGYTSKPNASRTGAVIVDKQNQPVGYDMYSSGTIIAPDAQQWKEFVQSPGSFHHKLDQAGSAEAIKIGAEAAKFLPTMAVKAIAAPFKAAGAVAQTAGKAVGQVAGSAVGAVTAPVKAVGKAITAEAGQDPMDHRGAVTDSFYESTLARIKSLALIK